jgi:hypothetical protein
MPEHILGIRAAPMRAGSRPAGIAGEMRSLHEQHGVRIVRFQDEAFPLRRRWVRELAGELEHAELIGAVVWRIACRPEQVERELFGMLRDAGLFLVAMPATDAGETDAGAIAILKSLGLLYEYDVAVREHVAFLRRVMGDGSGAPMVRPGDALGGWSRLAQRLNRALIEITVIERLIGLLDGIARYRRELAALTAIGNDELFRAIEESRGEPGAERVVAQLEEELARIRDAFVLRHQARIEWASAPT